MEEIKNTIEEQEELESYKKTKLAKNREKIKALKYENRLMKNENRRKMEDKLKKLFEPVTMPIPDKLSHVENGLAYFEKNESKLEGPGTSLLGVGMQNFFLMHKTIRLAKCLIADHQSGKREELLDEMYEL